MTKPATGGPFGPPKPPGPRSADPVAALLGVVARAAAGVEVAAWLVGGTVRDRLLGREPKDVDVAVEAGPKLLAPLLDRLAAEGLLAKARHDRFGTATFESGALRLDVAATRRETYPRPAALPVVTTPVPIAEDLARRDFTIHAMARPVEGGRLLDPFGGARDLDARTLRLLHEASLVDDPTRIFRAARYAARLGFAVAPEFARQLDACRRAGALEALSADRLRRALAEVLEEEAAERALALLSEWGVLAALAPALDGAFARVRYAEGLPGRWAALFEPLSVAARGALAERLNFSRALRRAVGLGR